MIVVDVNILVYLSIPEKFTAHAEALARFDREWSAPYLWRSEFCNVMAGYFRNGLLSEKESIIAFRYAESMIANREYFSDFIDVMSLIGKSKCSSYDCEYVSLAMRLGVDLVTMDKKILSEFPTVARPLTDFDPAH